MSVFGKCASTSAHTHECTASASAITRECTASTSTIYIQHVRVHIVYECMLARGSEKVAWGRLGEKARRLGEESTDP